MKINLQDIHKYLNSNKYDFKLFTIKYTENEKKTINNFILDKKSKIIWFGYLEPQSNGRYNILDKSYSTGKTIGKLAENIKLHAVSF